jgi:hypothetical protein
VEWGFIWLMFVLKIPIIALLWLVWWAVHQGPETAAPESENEGGDGGAKVHPARPHHPRRPFPRTPRRGPHGDPPVPSPPRTRAVVARARRPDRA